MDCVIPRNGAIFVHNTVPAEIRFAAVGTLGSPIVYLVVPR